jgi:hypothetical protein
MNLYGPRQLAENALMDPGNGYWTLIGPVTLAL